MTKFSLEIWDDELLLVTFYAVRKDGEVDSEVNKFLDKYRFEPKHDKKLQQLNALLLDTIGEQFGALSVFFTRQERAAKGLPPVFARISSLKCEFKKFPFRLYCLRINDSIVVLFGGGLKTAQTAQESPDLIQQFLEADFFAKTLKKAVQKGQIRITKDNRHLLSKTSDILIEAF